MPTFVFQCPNRGIHVQGWTVEDTSDDETAYAPVQCTACRRLHYVNPVTGRVLGNTDDNKDVTNGPMGNAVRCANAAGMRAENRQPPAGFYDRPETYIAASAGRHHVYGDHRIDDQQPRPR